MAKKHSNDKGLSKKEIKQVKRIIDDDMEPHYFDFLDYATSSINVAGTGWRLSNQIVKGTGRNQRLGDVIRLKGLKLKMEWHKNATPIDQQVRVIIYWDFTSNGANPDILRVQNGTSYPCVGPLDTAGNRVYYDKTLQLTTDRNAVYQDFYIDMKNEKYEYIKGFDDGTKGSIYMSVVSNSISNNASLNWSGRLYFRA